MRGFDEWGRDLRSLDERQDDELWSPAGRRLFFGAFAIAALIGFVCGLVWVAAGLWHFHVSPLF
jgi:hypothetical protein